MDRRDTVRIFRQRLADVIARTGGSRAAFAERIGIDRSTLAQVLSEANDRLPRAETLAAIAADQQVSIDWLLGLSQGGPLAPAIIEQPLTIEPGGHSPADERLTRWHAEAAGYKVRYVPSTLPDLLKTEELIRYEYRDYVGPIPESRIEAAHARLANQRRPETDMEVCSSVQGVESFARGEGIWRDLAAPARREQLEWMIALLDELYSYMLQPGCQYRHKWRVGDIVIWDNRSTVHNALGGYPLTENRIHWRTTIMEPRADETGQGSRAA